LQLTGEGGVLQQLTKRLLESALDDEITDNLGYDRHDPAGHNTGNSRNGARSKTLLTDVGPVQITVPRDRDGSFEPKIVAKRQKRLTGIDELVISLAAKGLTTGEISAHLAEATAPGSPAKPSPRSPTRSSRAWPNGRTGPWTRSLKLSLRDRDLVAQQENLCVLLAVAHQQQPQGCQGVGDGQGRQDEAIQVIILP
jgi:hypothetical protein